MGTRNLTMVILGGETKVAQYGQFDGYIEGAGVTALKFLQEVIHERFKERLSHCRFMNDDDKKELDDWLVSIGSVNGWLNMEQAQQYKEKYPYLTRDNGIHILEMIYHSNDSVILLSNSTDFSKDSLFCEYAYVIDYDKNTFEIYEGFNKKPLLETERFYNAECKGEYYPVRLLKSYALDNLPTVEQFLDDCILFSDEKVRLFIKNYGTEVKENEELMKDNHKCVEFDEKRYYIPDNLVLTEKEQVLYGGIFENYLVS